MRHGRPSFNATPQTVERMRARVHAPAHIVPSHFSDRLRWLRSGAAMSQMDLARAIGQAKADQISSWENERMQPNMTNLIALARALDVSLDMLIRGKEYERGEYPTA